MDLSARKTAFARLGDRIRHLDEATFQTLADRAFHENNWFRKEDISRALQGIAHFLEADALEEWLSRYAWPVDFQPQKVGVIMAGNIPAVGFHDLLSVLISGHVLHAKLSSKDQVIIKTLAKWLVELAPDFATRIHFEEQLKQMDAYIATGSNNAARYFEYYFRKYPHIIRKNRTAVAIIHGSETDAQLSALQHDALDYYGLGCRNVTKLYLPQDFPLERIMQLWESRAAELLNNHKYNNNYEYHRAIYLINNTPHFDNGGIIFREEENIFTPISIIHYSYYQNLPGLTRQLEARAEEIQCIVSAKSISGLSTIKPGSAQLPSLGDYADGVDTLAFLMRIGTPHSPTILE